MKYMNKWSNDMDKNCHEKDNYFKHIDHVHYNKKHDCCDKPDYDCCDKPKHDCCDKPKYDHCDKPKHDHCDKPKHDYYDKPDYDYYDKPKHDHCDKPKYDHCDKPKYDHCDKPKYDHCDKPKYDHCDKPKYDHCDKPKYDHCDKPKYDHCDKPKHDYYDKPDYDYYDKPHHPHKHHDKIDPKCYKEHFCDLPCDSNCCKGVGCKINPCKLDCVYTYLNILFDQATASGSPIVANPNMDNTNFDIETKYKGTCCNPCPVDGNSEFKIKKHKVSIIIESVDINGLNDVLVNGEPVTQINGAPPLAFPVTSKVFNATIDPSVDDEHCNDKCLGTKSSVFIQDVSNFNIYINAHVCGTVTTDEGDCYFDITFQRRTPVVLGGGRSSSFLVDDVCIPDLDTAFPARLVFNFVADSQLIKPELVSNGTPNDLTLTGTLVINPKVELAVVKESKVKLNVELADH